MLRTLHIENIAVIKCVDITFENGLTVLTGETGAGKSILIDSVGLLLGGKFNRDENMPVPPEGSEFPEGMTPPEGFVKPDKGRFDWNTESSENSESSSAT